MEENPQNLNLQDQSPKETTPINQTVGEELNGNISSEQPTFPWIKFAEALFVILAVINLGLLYFYFNGERTRLSDKEVGTEDTQGFLLTKPDQKISRQGYSITFSNPRYEHLGEQNNFRVDVTLENISIKPSIKVISNCDIEEKGKTVIEGVGVSVENGESTQVMSGNTAYWTALVILENKNQKVSNCIYAPEGIFDPNQTIRVVF